MFWGVLLSVVVGGSIAAWLYNHIVRIEPSYPTNIPAEAYPQSVRVSGFPFILQGWNGVYNKIGTNLHNGMPIYRLEPYVLYWFFPIVGATLSTGDSSPFSSWHWDSDNGVSSGGAVSMNLFGDWPFFFGIHVSHVKTLYSFYL